MPCSIPVKRNEAMGGFLFKSHSGKWILEVGPCVREQESSHAFSVAVSLSQKGQLSSLSYPFFLSLEIFLRQLTISSFNAPILNLAGIG